MYRLSFCLIDEPKKRRSTNRQVPAGTLRLVERKERSERFSGFLIEVTVAPQHRIRTDFPVPLPNQVHTIIC
jgi:hypothetical protein